MKTETSPMLLLALSASVLVFAFFLDWLQYKRPEWFGHGKPSPEKPRREPPHDRAKPAGPPSASPVPEASPKAQPGPEEPHEPAQTEAPPKAAGETPQECPFCGGYKRYDLKSLVVVCEDAYGSAYQCPECNRYLYYDNTYAKCDEVEEEWVRKNFPEAAPSSR